MTDPLQSPSAELTPYLILLAMALFGVITLWSVVRSLHEWLFPRPIPQAAGRMRQEIEFDTGALPSSSALAAGSAEDDDD